jgi:hypothetical protein
MARDLPCEQCRLTLWMVAEAMAFRPLRMKVMDTAGYLVLLRDVSTHRGTLYEGIDRLPPWTPEIAEAGLDLELIASVEDEVGVLTSLAGARLVAAHWRRFIHDELEICAVRTEGAQAVEDWRVLGWDIAAGAPFWSIVEDFPAVEELGPFQARLNDHGLYPDASAAREYLDAYRRLRESEPRGETLEEESEPLRLWEVRRMPAPMPANQLQLPEVDDYDDSA